MPSRWPPAASHPDEPADTASSLSDIDSADDLAAYEPLPPQPTREPDDAPQTADKDTEWSTKKKLAVTVLIVELVAGILTLSLRLLELIGKYLLTIIRATLRVLLITRNRRGISHDDE